MSRDPRPTNQSGYSLVELLVAMTVLLVGMAGVVSMLDGANARTVSNRSREAGTALVRELVERSRSVPYPAITTAGLPGRLQAMQGLADADAATPGWQIDRRGTRFTVTVHACSVDDPKDGFGVRDAASWCAGGGTGTADSNPDDYKRVTVVITWAQADARGRAREQTLINSPGNAAGPSVAALTPGAGVGANDTVGPCPCPASIAFTVTTTGVPATVSWLMDGGTQGTATGSGLTWSFTWPIANLTDGAYLIAARAFDSAGRSGASRSRTITLNRFAPLKPRGFAAGPNGSIVDAEWLANSERDIVGYRVYRRVGSGAWEQVGGPCASDAGQLTRRTSCYDPAPPAQPATYVVRALDRTVAGALREGPDSDPVLVPSDAEPPAPVTSIQRQNHPDGSVTLTWTAPPGSPPAAFYRIYRGGTAFTNRYDRTGSGTETTWTDGHTGGTAHRYWITAVSSQLAESTATEAPGP